MNRSQLYFKTSTILIDAYQNQTLFHNHPITCIKGNLIAANLGYTVHAYITRAGFIYGLWKTKEGTVPLKQQTYLDMLFATTLFDRLVLRFVIGKEQCKLQKANLKSTGYSWKEMKTLMDAFDIFYEEKQQCKHVLPALKNVLRVLKGIHKVTDLDVQLNYHQAFAQEELRLVSLPAKYELHYSPFRCPAEKKKVAGVTSNCDAKSKQILFEGNPKLQLEHEGSLT